MKRLKRWKMTREQARELIANGTIHKGLTKAEVRKLFGPPDATGMPTRNYPEPSIWLYGKVEFWFLTQKKRHIPNEGAELHGVYTENDDHTEGTMLLK